MQYQLRDYQQQASKKAVQYFNSKTAKNALMVLPTGSGKSLIIADIAHKLNDPTLIFQPSKEILEQNFAKLHSYGVWDCSVFSASFNSKNISRITFATIGSVRSHPELFNHFKNVIIDECHGVNAKQGMYSDFLDTLPCKVLGLTATPYRLSTDGYGGSILKFITRTRPRVFHDLIYHVQISELLKRGYLSKLEYYQIKAVDSTQLKLNTTGADYTDKSVKDHYRQIGFNDRLISIVRRLLNAGRENILVFTRFIEEAEYFVSRMPGISDIVTGETPKKEREQKLKDFKSGKIKIIANVGVLTCLSDDTEILTRNKGWVKMDNMEMSDMVAQYDQANGNISFANPLRIIQNDNFQEDFIGLHGRYMDFLVTHNHKMLYSKRDSKGLGRVRKCNASEIVGKRIYMPVSGFSEVEQMEVNHENRCSDNRFIATNSYNFRKKGMDYQASIDRSKELLKRRNNRQYKSPHQLTIDECRFIGFWLGDGSRWKSKDGGERFSLTQSFRTPDICKWIESVMDKCKIHYTTHDYDGKSDIQINGCKCKMNGYRTYNLPKGTGGDGQGVDSNLYSLLPYLQKHGTDLYWGLNSKQYFCLMEGLFMADGWHGNGIKYTGQPIIGEYKDLFDLLQSIGVCRGFRVTLSIVKKREFNIHQLYKISLRDKRFHQVVAETAELVTNTEKKHVWCVTMPLGNIVTRRNGRVTILGNCGFDFPELSTIVLGRPTMSLALYYQMIGRAIRPHPSKESAWIIDLCENYKRFGKVEELELTADKPGMWYIRNRQKTLTNVYYD